jgi:hypothetical protein
MISKYDKMSDHERFKELGALANSGTLTTRERAELKEHLQICEPCRKVCGQYLTLIWEGIPLLAGRYSDEEEHGSWDDTATRRKLFAHVRESQQEVSSKPGDHLWVLLQHRLLQRIPMYSLKGSAIAACLVVAIGFGAYRLGSRAQSSAKRTQAYAEDRFQRLAAATKSGVELLDAQSKRLSELQDESSRDSHELAKLRLAFNALEARANELTAANNAAQEQSRAVSQERDALNGKLRDAEQAFQNVQAEFTSLRAERDNALLQAATLQSRIDELSVANRDQERRLEDDEQYLASDRDIRELMGARKLYIADVFDVDSGSLTRKPFGRVFYTQGKFLLFYAFDLDRQPGVKAASTFQAWSRKMTDRGEQRRPESLGILYQDSELNRRWVLRCDDQKQLEEIDDVFVTVEPHGGSREPTGKPILFALLRKEANHP